MNHLQRISLLTILFTVTQVSIFAQENSTLNSSLPAVNLRVGIYEKTPYMFQDNNGNWDGISVRLWRSVANELNYTFEFEETSENSAVSALRNSEIDILLLTEVNSANDSLVDFSLIYHTAQMGIATSPVMDITSILKSFFSQRFWYIVIILSLLLLVVGTIMYFVERKTNEENFGGERSIIKGIGSGFWWAGVTMTTIGYGDKAPVTFWGRAVALLWMLIAMAVTAVLTASIVSAVMGGASSTKPTIPGDLREMQLLALENTKASAYLSEERVAFEKVSDLKDGLDLVNKKKKDALLHSMPELKNIVNSNSSISVKIQPVNLDPNLYAMGITDSSTIRNELNTAILKVIQSPNWQRELDKFIPESRSN